MLHVTSKDGTRIAYEKTGDGPALIIIGGSLGDHRFYIPLATELAERFTVYNFDRRGRGESGDTEPYAVEREVEDVAALIADASRPALVYGHSAGSALALHAAAAGLHIAKLVLADAPFRPHGDADDEARARQGEFAARIDELHDAGDHRGAATFFLMTSFGLPREAVDGLFDSPGGEMMLDSARALPYDFALVGDSLVPNELAAEAAAPTLILAPQTSATATALAEAMPQATVRTMRAPTYELAPHEIAEVITPFLVESDVPSR